MELDSIAALPIKNYSFWSEKQIERAARNKVRKAQKNDVIMKLATFEDHFVEGMDIDLQRDSHPARTTLMHYGKDFETVKGQFSWLLLREEIFGAYLGKELVGLLCWSTRVDTRFWVKLFPKSRTAIWQGRGDVPKGKLAHTEQG
jgi:hypothetical protein